MNQRPFFRHRRIALLLAALFLFVRASADEASANAAAQTVQLSQNVTINLINRMVERGLLTKEDAVQLVQLAEAGGEIGQLGWLDRRQARIGTGRSGIAHHRAGEWTVGFDGSGRSAGLTVTSQCHYRCSPGGQRRRHPPHVAALDFSTENGQIDGGPCQSPQMGSVGITECHVG